MNFYLIPPIAAALMISGCNSTPVVPTTESFVTQIGELGHKRFTYKATLGPDRPSGQKPRRAPPGGTPKGSRKGGKPNGGKPGAEKPSGNKPNTGEIRKIAMERMEFLLHESSFCPNGWFLIEQTIDQNRAEILGECRAESP
ncbi:hypothetical protein ACCI51_01290 [Microbulbifer echini]|uniref:Lipoprotein n=1 Tax=Microbulbifer echini TaxID=1529067 RepID=A0ABV4NHZ6_9GAMM